MTSTWWINFLILFRTGNQANPYGKIIQAFCQGIPLPLLEFEIEENVIEKHISSVEIFGFFFQSQSDPESKLLYNYSHAFCWCGCIKKPGINPTILEVIMRPLGGDRSKLNMTALA